MSFDPFNQQQPPRDPIPPQGVTPNPRPGESAPPPAGASAPGPAGNARDRVLFPAVLLFLSGLVTLGFGLLFLVVGSVTTAEMIENTKQNQQQLPPWLRDMMQSSGLNAASSEDVAAQTRMQYFGIGGVNLLACLLTTAAGVRLLQLKSYGFVLFSSILVALPCVTGSGCCCVGQVAGLWTLVLLLQPDVRDAFH